MIISDLNYLETASLDVVGGTYFDVTKINVYQKAYSEANAWSFKGDAKAISVAANVSLIG